MLSFQDHPDAAARRSQLIATLEEYQVEEGCAEAKDPESIQVTLACESTLPLDT